jgi:hypothetical protein
MSAHVVFASGSGLHRFQHSLTKLPGTIGWLLQDGLPRLGHCIWIYKNAALREIKLVYWQATSLIPVLTALQMRPVLKTLQVDGLSNRRLAGQQTFPTQGIDNYNIQWFYWGAGGRL